MLNANDPFYRPVWRRAVIVAVCLGWGMVELLTGSPGFAIIFLALGALAAYRLFLTYSPDAQTSSLSDDPKDD
ncbi:hypothetical protein [Yoonia maritima]|uniref:hypothetical protein n=1 Tax=Yoonia maritima TaxID=1435347 RepID=UPI000D0EF632|nr:hypothetical protein [Yoonia maritima]